jgi:hypothetical protein
MIAKIRMRFLLRTVLFFTIFAGIALFMPAAQNLDGKTFCSLLSVWTAEAQESSPPQGWLLNNPAGFPISNSQLTVKPVLIETFSCLNQKINYNPASCEEVINYNTSGWLLKYQAKSGKLNSLKTEIKILSLGTSKFLNAEKMEEIANSPGNSSTFVNFTQQLGSFSCGMGYRYLTKDLDNLVELRKEFNNFVKFQPDQQGYELWAAREFGPLRLRGYVSRLTDNVEQDPQRYKMLSNQYGIELNYKASFMPLCFGVSYANANSVSLRKPIGADTRATFGNVYSVYIYYYLNSRFDINFSSSYSPIYDKLNQENKINFFYHEFVMSIRPTYYTYISFYGSLSQMIGNNGSQNSRDINSWIQLCWYPNDLLNKNKIYLSLNVGYEKYLDKCYPHNSYKAIYSLCTMKINF